MRGGFFRLGIVIGLAVVGLGASPRARGQPSEEPPITTPPAYSLDRALSTLLLDPSRGPMQETNAQHPICVLFVVDVSGSMNALWEQQRRIDRCRAVLHALLKSPALQHPDTCVGILRAGRQDPGASSFLKPIQRYQARSDEWTAKGFVESILTLETETDRGSNLRAAHYRGLEAITQFCDRCQPPIPPEARYLVFLTDGYADGPQQEPPGSPSVKIWQALQQPSDDEFRRWTALCTQATTLVIEPYNPHWLGGPAKLDDRTNKRRNLFPDELLRGVAGAAQEFPGLTDSPMWEGHAVVQGVCVAAPAGVTPSIVNSSQLDLLQSVGSADRRQGVTIAYTVRSEGEEPITKQVVTGPDGQFFFTLDWRAGEPVREKRLVYTASGSGLAGKTSGELVMEPGDLVGARVSLPPQFDPWPWVIGFVIFLIVVLVVWPWELRVNGGPALPLHLLQPQHLYLPGSYQKQAKISHFVVNWLQAGSGARVRVDRRKTGTFRPIPGRCHVEINGVPYLLDSGFRHLGRRPKKQSPVRPRSGRRRV